jgi:hypothetical protein
MYYFYASTFLKYICCNEPRSIIIIKWHYPHYNLIIYLILKCFKLDIIGRFLNISNETNFGVLCTDDCHSANLMHD